MSKTKNTINKSTISVKESTLQKLKENATSLIKQSQRSFYELGDTLIIIKSMIGHNKFSKWLEDEVDFSHNLANKYMRIAENYPEEQAIELGVRKAYALLSLKKDDRDKFLKDHDVPKMTCSELEKMIKEMKGSKTTDNKVKAKNFIRNIDSFKKDLSSKIKAFIQYKDEADEVSLNIIRENQDIFDFLEKFNALTNPEIVNNSETPDYKYEDEYIIELEGAVEETEETIDKPKQTSLFYDEYDLY